MPCRERLKLCEHEPAPAASSHGFFEGDAVETFFISDETDRDRPILVAWSIPVAACPLPRRTGIDSVATLKADVNDQPMCKDQSGAVPPERSHLHEGFFHILLDSNGKDGGGFGWIKQAGPGDSRPPGSPLGGSDAAPPGDFDDRFSGGLRRELGEGLFIESLNGDQLDVSPRNRFD